MPQNWKTYKLGDLCTKITDGAHHSPKSVDSGGMPMASVKDMTPYGLNLETARRISGEDYQSLVKQGCQPEINDVLIAKDGNSALDTVCVIRDDIDTVLLSSVAILKPDLNIIDPYFLKYYFSTPFILSYLKSSFISGAAIPRVILKAFKLAEINLPPLPEQQAIASVLSSLDDKIELNLQMNKTLEEMAMTLYKHWFLDFGPFKEGKFIASELGSIPEGWEVKRLDELFSVKDGTHDSPKQKDEGHYLITSKHIKKNEIDFSNAYKISVDDYEKVNQRSKVEHGDILMTMIGTVGVFHLVTRAPNYAIKNLGLFKTSEKPELRHYIYLFFSSEYGSQYINSQLAGSTQQYLTLKVLRSFPCLYPPDSITKSFDAHVSDLFKNIAINIQENQTLTTLRDTLLPKLISGEVRVKDVEQTVAEAV